MYLNHRVKLLYVVFKYCIGEKNKEEKVLSTNKVFEVLMKYFTFYPTDLHFAQRRVTSTRKRTEENNTIDARFQCKKTILL